MSSENLYRFDTNFTFPLAIDRVAMLRIKWPVEESDIDLLITTLQLWKKTLCLKPAPMEIKIDPTKDPEREQLSANIDAILKSPNPTQT
jgi:hypothetical protein